MDPIVGVFGVGVLLRSSLTFGVVSPLVLFFGGRPRFFLVGVGVSLSFSRFNGPRSSEASVFSRATWRERLLDCSYCCTRSSTCGDDDGDEGRVLSVPLPLTMSNDPLVPFVDSGAGLDSEDATEDARLIRFTTFLRPLPDFFGGAEPKLKPDTAFCGPAWGGSVHSGIFCGGVVSEVMVIK